MHPSICLAIDLTGSARSELRWELAGVGIGFILLSIGIAGLAFFLFRRQSRDFALVYFSSFSLLYAVRLLLREGIVRSVFPADRSALDHFTLAIDCFIVIPFTLFLMQIVEPQWRKALRWILAAQIVFGVMRFLSLLIHSGEKFMGLANNVFVIAVCALLAVYYIAVRRAKSQSREITVVFAGLAIFALFAIENNLAYLKVLPQHDDVEPIGFFIFVCCLGYVTPGVRSQRKNVC